MQWCCLTHRFTRGLAVNDQSTDASFEVQSKLQKASSLVLDLLLPQLEVARICDELKYEYRECIYHPMITVWMFISQVPSADHSCQQAVTRFNAYRVAKGLIRVSSETTSYCKARCKLPEQIFERLLSWKAKRQSLAAGSDLVSGFHGTERYSCSRRSSPPSLSRDLVTLEIFP